MTAPTADCPGSPNAAAGQLCLYVDAGTVELVSHPATLGFGLRLTADGRAAGTWAVTAP